ncbi:MAG: hypothetical protein EP326_08750 [Deltaproteobacteria bacterium]|nr:MAG: hypothetical protein EP326_08750 [Deltaproteobacteria bacterium]TNF28907.1 MAG: hypothetical protein EP319_08015 [Deltaproteobacteria bacterium]
MENYFGLLIAVLILLTVVLTAILAVIVYMVFFKKEDKPVQASPTTDEVDTPQLKASAKKPIIDTPILTTCKAHEEARAVNVCAICGDQLCELCVREDEHIVFCPEHFKTYVDHKWVEISNVRTTADTPEASAYVYEFKRKIWKREGTPTFIVTHYKIDLDNDQIESYVKLMVREEEESDLSKRLNESIQ